MIYFSILTKKEVFDSNNKKIGLLKDIVISLKDIFPAITAIVVKPYHFENTHISNESNSFRHEDIVISWNNVGTLEGKNIVLNVPTDQVNIYELQSEELYLGQDILDKQIVDTQGFRVVKVNDLKIVQIKGIARLVGADISFRAILRRLGVEAPYEAITKVLPVKIPDRTITWNYVEPLDLQNTVLAESVKEPVAAAASTNSTNKISSVRLNISHTKLSELHPADIADIVEQLSIDEAGLLLGQLDTETAADTLNEMEPFLQAELVSEMEPELASNLLEVMPPDTAADIIGELEVEQAEHLLELMPLEESKPIRELLQYEHSTAGGIMTTEVLALSRDMTIEKALQYLREQGEHLEMVYYLYVVDDDRHLLGVVSLRKLVVGSPEQRLEEAMDKDIIKVSVDMDQEEVANIISKYDLLAVPVVDENQKLVGLVTVDDVIDVLNEEQAEDFSAVAGTSFADLAETAFTWSATFKRMGWLLLNVCTGILAALLLERFFVPSNGLNVIMSSKISAIILFIPLLLLSSGSIGARELGIAEWYLHEQKGLEFWRGVIREIRLETTGGIFASVLVGFASYILFHSLALAVALGLSIGFTLFIAAMCGLLIPMALKRMTLDGRLVSTSLLDPYIALISLITYLALTVYLIIRFHVV